VSVRTGVSYINGVCKRKGAKNSPPLNSPSLRNREGGLGGELSLMLGDKEKYLTKKSILFIFPQKAIAHEKWA